jgi:Zn-dependent protease
MRATFRLGRVAGIPIGVHWSLLVIAALLTTSLAGSLLPAVLPNAEGSYWAAALLAAGIFFASILAHELAHALVARRFGQKVEDITLWILGGVARLGSEAPSPRAEALVALAGPGTSLLLGGGFLGVGSLLHALGGESLLAVVLVWLGAINVLLAVFNALPGSPLDGGRVVSAIVWKRTGDRHRGHIAGARAGRVVGGALMALGLANIVLGIGFGTLWTAFIGWFIFDASRAEELAARATRALEGRRVRDLMTPSPPEIGAWLTAGDVRASAPPPAHPHRRFVVREYDGSVRSTVPVEAIRRLPAEVAVRDAAEPALVTPADRLVTDALAEREAVSAIVAMEDSRVVGVIGPEELAAARGQAEPVG